MSHSKKLLYRPLSVHKHFVLLHLPLFSFHTTCSFLGVSVTVSNSQVLPYGKTVQSQCSQDKQAGLFHLHSFPKCWREQTVCNAVLTVEERSFVINIQELGAAHLLHSSTTIDHQSSMLGVLSPDSATISSTSLCSENDCCLASQPGGSRCSHIFPSNLNILNICKS